LPEININAKTGYLSTVGNVKEMAANAIRLLEDESLHEKFKLNAKANADLFDIHNIVPQYEKLYNRFLPKPEKILAVGDY